jgi:FkbM family methyltransferase
MAHRIVRRLLETRVTPLIASHREAPPIRALARCCSRFLDAYHNVNWECSSNGELFVLDTLATADFREVVDVGANVGAWTALARAAFPHAVIHCFELDDDTCRRLAVQVSALDRVRVNCCGLSDTPGEAWFKSYPTAPEMTSILDYPHAVPSVRKRGLLMMGDEYVEANHIDRLDFVKIDVEGSERRVLDGFIKTISRGAIDVIQFEYGRANILARQFLRDMYAFFDAYGYAIGKIYPRRVDFKPYALADEDFRGLNYLAVRRSREDLITRLSR